MQTQPASNRAKLRTTSLLASVAALTISAALPALAGETPIHEFAGAPTDGANPTQTLLKVGHYLYGLSASGGAFGLGAVYRLPVGGGATTLLYSFQGGADGAVPRGNLINVGGTLYGTTAQGGTGTNCSFPFPTCGTVFSITTAGVEHVIHSFQGGSDGSAPFATLLNVGGVMYGTTVTGGSPTCVSSYPSCGTIFKITTSGVETVVHAFQGGSDGTNPFGTLIKSGNTLYGTTAYGGGACTIWSKACGTVFKLNLSSNIETVLHAFTFADGADPQSSTVVKQGNELWGVTAYGGLYNAGVAFAIPTTGGAETFHYDFTGGTDGGNPTGALTNLGGTLYGITLDGGITGCRYLYPFADGCGTIYKILPTGIQTLYAFQGGTDGGNPDTTLAAIGSALYGTTNAEGLGTGTVFRFTP